MVVGTRKRHPNCPSQTPFPPASSRLIPEGSATSFHLIVASLAFPPNSVNLSVDGKAPRAYSS